MSNHTTLPKNPRVLIIGNGAREHAIAWKLAQSVHQPVLFAAPGNPGLASISTLVDLGVSEIAGIMRFVKNERIDFVVIGPEQPLSDGLSNACLEAGVPVFGPTQSAAQLESSKAFAKDLMKRANVPTAKFEVFNDARAAKEYIVAAGAPIVIKADGLAAGKGVVVASTVEEAIQAIDDMMVNERFGASGSTIVVEEFMEGREVSLMFFVDKNMVVPMLSARDHKRIYDGDKGPNTGGMGAFAPVTAFESAGLTATVQKKIVEPTLQSLRDEGITYRGVLYVGLMLTSEGPKVVEFNARFGDPETEVVLPLLETDLLELMWAVAHDELSEISVAWKQGAAVCVVLAAPGYPEAVRVGSRIALPSQLPQGAVAFHAGTKTVNGELTTSGGRVLTVSAVGESMEAARRLAYETAETISFEGKQNRTDIALHWSI